MSGIVDTITGVFKTESNNAANMKGAMNTFAKNANNKSYGTAATAPKPESGFLNTITGLFASKNDSAINVRAKVMAMNKNANNKTYGKNTNSGWFSTIKQAFKSTSRPLNPNAPEFIPQSTATMIQSTQGGRRKVTRRQVTRRRANGRRRN
jgi:hypothetical protein